jgi:hypothetical protein
LHHQHAGKKSGVDIGVSEDDPAPFRLVLKRKFSSGCPTLFRSVIYDDVHRLSPGAPSVEPQLLQLEQSVAWMKLVAERNYHDTFVAFLRLSRFFDEV